MAKFRFTLQPLLKARSLVEQSHQRAVAAIERERMRLEENLRNQQARINQGKQQLRDSLVGNVDAHSLRMHAAASMHTSRAAQRMVLELAGVHRRLEAARARLIEASRARRAVEILRDQRFEQWKKESDKIETDAIDELAVTRASRQSPPLG
jgi:flagellar protein FliJ